MKPESLSQPRKVYGIDVDSHESIINRQIYFKIKTIGVNMQRSHHLTPEPIFKLWKLNSSSSKSDMTFEVNDQNNTARFDSFQICNNDGKINCNLLIQSDKATLDKIEKELGQAIVDNSGFFQSFKLAKSIERQALPFGYYILKTQDPKMTEIMVNFVDRKLQFTGDQYDSLLKIISNPKNEAGQVRRALHF